MGGQIEPQGVVVDKNGFYSWFERQESWRNDGQGGTFHLASSDLTHNFKKNLRPNRTTSRHSR